MSRINRIKFDLGETQGRQYEEDDNQDYNQDYQDDNQDDNQDYNQDSEYDSWEEMYHDEVSEVNKPEVYTEEPQPEQPLTEEEMAVLKSLEEAKRQAKQQPTETDMEAAYNDFIAQVDAEKKEKEDSMIREISIWVSNGNQVKGETLEDHYTFMTEQKIVQEKERKEQEEKERQKQAKKAEQTLIAAQNRRSLWDMETTRKQKAGTTRPAHTNGPNKLGHLQGEKEKLRKKQLEAAEKMKAVETLQREKRSQILLVEEAKKKAERVFSVEKIEEEKDEKIGEDEEYVAVPLKEESQLANLIKEAVQQKKESENKKKQEKDSWKKVEKKKIVQTLPTVVPPEPKPTQNKYTMMCKSITNPALGKCPHGAKCRFAHRLDQLVQTECAFGLKCRFTKQVKPGVFCNHQNKVCTYWHPEETVNSYAVRIGLKHMVSQAQVSPPVSAPVSAAVCVVPVSPPVSAPISAPPTKFAPWAKKPTPPTPPVPPRKSRWDIAPPVPPTPPVPPHMSRWDM